MVLSEDILKSLFGDILNDNEELCVFVDIAVAVFQDILDDVDTFPYLGDIFRVKDDFLTDLADRVGYDLLKDKPNKFQREIIKRVLLAYKYRGLDDALLKAAKRSVDNSWVRDDLTLYEGRIKEQFAEMFYTRDYVFRFNISKFDDIHRLSSAVYRDGVIYLNVEVYNSRVVESVLKELPAGIRMFFIELSDLIYNGGPIPAGDSNVYSFTNSFLDVIIRDNQDGLVLSGEMPFGYLDGRRILFNTLQSEFSIAATSLPMNAVYGNLIHYYNSIYAGESQYVYSEERDEEEVTSELYGIGIIGKDKVSGSALSVEDITDIIPDEKPEVPTSLDGFIMSRDAILNIFSFSGKELTEVVLPPKEEEDSYDVATIEDDNSNIGTINLVVVRGLTGDIKAKDIVHSIDYYSDRFDVDSVLYCIDDGFDNIRCIDVDFRFSGYYDRTKKAEASLSYSFTDRGHNLEIPSGLKPGEYGGYSFSFDVARNSRVLDGGTLSSENEVCRYLIDGGNFRDTKVLNFIDGNQESDEAVYIR